MNIAMLAHSHESWERHMRKTVWGSDVVIRRDPTRWTVEVGNVPICFRYIAPGFLNRSDDIRGILFDGIMKLEGWEDTRAWGNAAGDKKLMELQTRLR